LAVKIEILVYVARSRPTCLEALDDIQAYKKIRSKLFNERKKVRNVVLQRIF